MHVCFVTHEYPQPDANHGGVGVAVQTLGRLLVKAGHRVSVVGTWREHHDAIERDEGVVVHRVRGSRLPAARCLPNSIRINRTLAEIDRHTPIDVIEAPDTGLAFLSARVKAPRVMRMHGGHLFHRHELLEKPALWRTFQERRSSGKADYHVSVGRYVGEVTARLLRLEHDKVTVIHNLVDDAEFHLPDSPHRPDPCQLLTIGSVCRLKGLRELVLATLEVIGDFPSAVLTIAGRDVREAKTGVTYREAELLPLIPPGAQQHFRFLGAIGHSEIPDLLTQSGICIFPSHTEAMPVAWLETLAMGRPLIGADIGPGRELIRDGFNGLLCKPYDRKDIAEKIKSLLGSESLRERLAANARRDFRERFSTEKLLDENIRFFEHCIEDHAKRQNGASC
ncbi:MAG: glycosyltransferase family 4 protein [Pirellulales bacterium]|nr:glycosyltransferase family 4 protein [Pirellulales bacterium]